MKLVKEEMRKLAFEDPDEAFEIISSTSSKTLDELETEEGGKTTILRQDSAKPPQESDTQSSFSKLKTKLKKTATWLNENKDKSLDDILMERWRDGCSEESLKTAKAKCKQKARKKKKSTSSKCKSVSAKAWQLLILRYIGKVF